MSLFYEVSIAFAWLILQVYHVSYPFLFSSLLPFSPQFHLIISLLLFLYTTAFYLSLLESVPCNCSSLISKPLWLLHIKQRNGLNTKDSNQTPTNERKLEIFVFKCLDWFLKMSLSSFMYLAANFIILFILRTE